MADNDQKPGDGQNLLLLNLPNLAVFLFLGWGVLSTKAPLTSLRPDSTLGGQNTVLSENIEARFWQDPFVWRINPSAGLAQPTAPNPNDAFILNPTVVPAPSPNSDTTALGLIVLLNGDRYPEAIEARIRARYAIVSAMLQGGYAGDKAGDLNLSLIQDSKHVSLSPRFPIAWEKFSAFSPAPYRLYPLDAVHKESPDRQEPRKRYSQVDIYYVNEADLENSALVAATDPPGFFPKLSALVTVLSQNMMTRLSIKQRQCNIAVLGPSDSPHFVDLVIGAIKDDITHTRPEEGLRPAFDVYSPQPTVSPVVLRKLVADQEGLNYDIAAHYITNNQDAIYLNSSAIFRTNGNDDELLLALMDELEARGLKLASPTERIALITEADTVYGKTIPGRFVQLLRQRSLEEAAKAAYGSDGHPKVSIRPVPTRRIAEPNGPLKEMSARIDEINLNINNLGELYSRLFQLQKDELKRHLRWRSSSELLTLISRELADPAVVEMLNAQDSKPPPQSKVTTDEEQFNDDQTRFLNAENELQSSEIQLSADRLNVKTDEDSWSKLDDRWKADRQTIRDGDTHQINSPNLEKDISAIRGVQKAWLADRKPLPDDQMRCLTALNDLKEDEAVFDFHKDIWDKDLGKKNRNDDTFRDYKALFFEWALLTQASALCRHGDSEKAQWELATETPHFSRLLDYPKEKLDEAKDLLASDWRRDNLGSRKIQVFTYLRGVDGQSAAGPSSKGDKGETSGDSSAKGDYSSAPALGQESAQGTAQFDYIRRMIDELLDSQKKNNSPFRAIGVTGSDVYDKLVILRALKQQFPAAFLFTTDLNAAYLQSTEAPFARNLLIGSHYNLTIAPGPGTLQFSSMVAPFRDSYQTATYYSCLKILNPGNLATNDPPAAGVFEVARDGFYPLSRTDDARLPNAWANGLELPGIVVTGAILLFALCTNLYFVANRGNTIPMIFLCFLSSAFLSIIFFWIRHLSSLPTEEPFAVFEGISTWPSTIIRAVDLVLVGYFIFRIRHLLEFDFSSVEPLKRALLAAHPVMKKRRGFINPMYSLFEWDSENLPANSTPTSYRIAFENCEKQIKWKWPILQFVLARFGFKYPNTSAGPATEEAYKQAVDDFKKKDSFRRALLYKVLLYFRFKIPVDEPGTLHDRILEFTFEDFQSKGLRWGRISRVSVALVAFAVFVFVVMCALGLPVDPTRGIESRILVISILILAVLAVIVLTFVVVDALALSQSMIVWLENRILDVKEHFAKTNESPEILAKSEVLREAFEFAAAHTKAVTSIIYFPFIAILLLLFARDSLFAHYDWPPSLVIVIATPFLALAWTMYCLQRDAERMRLTAIDTLKDDVRKLRSNKESKEKLESEIAWLTKDLDEGAFANFSKAPFVRALLIPLGGVGSLQLLEYLRQFIGG